MIGSMGEAREPLRVRLSAHAKQRMIDRNITEREVRYVLAAPDVVYPSGAPGRTAFRATIGGRRLVVVVAHGSDPVLVITAWEA